jgi:RNA polymerase sigma factor (sigma-70 family)|nr:response regulator [Caldimonas sp.]
MQGDTVFIVDDDASVRDALSLLLSLRGHRTATFASAEDFLAALQPDWQGCIVVDIRMAGMSGLELQQVLLERLPSLPVIVITAHGDVSAARQAFLAAAVDFLEKPFDGDQLVATIENALADRRPARPARAASAAAQRALAALSPREREVMSLLVKGMHNRSIAEALGISPRTVEVHKARVMDKLGVENLVELVHLVDLGRG